MPESLSQSLANGVASLFPGKSVNELKRPGERVAYSSLRNQAVDPASFDFVVSRLHLADKGGRDGVDNATRAMKEIVRLGFEDEGSALGLLKLAMNSPNDVLKERATAEHATRIAESQAAVNPVEAAPALTKDRYAPIILATPIRASRR